MSLVLMLVTAAALGRALGRLFPLGQDLEGWLFRGALGLCGVAAAALFAGSRSLLLAQTLLVALILAAVVVEVAVMVYNRPRRRRTRIPAAAPAPVAPPEEPPRPPRRRRGPLETTCLVLLGVAALLTFLASWTPATSVGATADVLALAKAWEEAGRIAPTPLLPHADAPGLLRPLYALAWFGSGERPAAGLSWALAMLAAGFAWALARRLAGDAAGAAAAALVAGMPVFFPAASTAVLESGRMALTLAAFAALAAALAEGRVLLFLLCGVLSGAALAFGAAVAPLLLLLPLAALLRPSGGPAGGRALSAALTLAGCLVFPAVMALHGGLSQTWEMLHPQPPSDAVAVLRFPWDAMMRPTPLGGWAVSPGGMALALAAPALVFGGARVRLLLLTAMLGLWAGGLWERSAGAAAPLCAVLVAAGAGGALRTERFRPALAALAVAGVVFGLTLHAARLAPQAAVLTGQLARDEWLEDRVPRYAAVVAANARLADLPPGRALVLDQAAYYYDVPPLAHPAVLERVAAMAPGDRLDWLRNGEVRLVVLPLDFLGPDSPLPPAVRGMLNSWTETPSLFKPLDEMESPRIGAKGVEVTRLYRVVLMP